MIIAYSDTKPRVNSSELMVSGSSRGGNVKFTMGKYTISDGRHELLSNRTLVSRVSAKLIRQQVVKIFSVCITLMLFFYHYPCFSTVQYDRNGNSYVVDGP